MKKLLRISALVLLPAVSFAQWNTDSTVRNPVCTAMGFQHNPRSCSDGSGGAIFVWVDERNSGSFGSVYSQHFTAKGKPLFAANGIVILNGLTSNEGVDYTTVVTDGSGGAIIVTEVSVIGGERQLYAQHMDASGALLWGNGVKLTDLSDARINWAGDPEEDGISADGAGGVFVTYGAGQAYAQHVNASGSLVWGSTGVGMPLNGGNLYNGYRSTIESTGNGTAVVGFSNLGGGSFYMQRIAANGSYMWGSAGLLVSSQYINQNFEPAHIITYDAANAAILVAYLTEPYTTSNVFVQKIDLNGNILWKPGGIVLTGSTTQNVNPDIMPDAKGGMFLCYTSNSKTMVQRVNAAGKKLWGANGIQTDLTISADEHFPVIVSDGKGGIINVYKTSRNGAGYYSIYAQRFTLGGAPVWRANGVPVIIAYADINHEVNNTVASTKGFAITCWHDSRNAGDNNDIYAAREGGTSGFGFLPETMPYTLAAFQNKVNANVAQGDHVINYGNTMMMGQNFPNPFTHTTTISYTLPLQYTLAKIMVTNKSGQVLKEINISGKGNGNIVIDAATLAAGTYQYSLFIDGNLKDSKQMIIVK